MTMWMVWNPGSRRDCSDRITLVGIFQWVLCRVNLRICFPKDIPLLASMLQCLYSCSAVVSSMTTHLGIFSGGSIVFTLNSTRYKNL